MTLIWITLLQTAFAVPCLPEQADPINYSNLSANNLVALSQVQDIECPTERIVQLADLTKLLNIEVTIDSKNVAIAKLIEQSQKNEIRQMSFVLNFILFGLVIALIVRIKKKSLINADVFEDSNTPYAELVDMFRKDVESLKEQVKQLDAQLSTARQNLQDLQKSKQQLQSSDSANLNERRLEDETTLDEIDEEEGYSKHNKRSEDHQPQQTQQLEQQQCEISKDNKKAKRKEIVDEYKKLSDKFSKFQQSEPSAYPHNTFSNFFTEEQSESRNDVFSRFIEGTLKVSEDVETLKRNGHETDLFVITSQVIQIYSIYWGLNFCYPEHFRDWDTLKKRWEQFKEELNSTYKCTICFELDWFGMTKDQMNKEKQKNEVRIGNYAFVSTGDNQWNNKIVGFTTVQIDLKEYKLQYETTPCVG